MEDQHFQLYKLAIASGDRRLAKVHLAPFIESFGTLEERIRWTKEYLETEFDGSKIRHEIYESIIFPTLLDGYEREDPWSLRWLALTIQNLYKSERLWKRVGLKTDIQFLKELLSLCPDDESAKGQLLNRMIDGFHYSVHEWPSGILGGMNFASVRECDEILDEISTARTLDLESRYTDFLNDFEQKVREYRQLRSGWEKPQ